jgi:site-specific DNA-methyltransferase (adenine-specific)
MKTILVINALNGVFPLVLRKRYPHAKITCAEIFPFYKHHLRNLGFEVMDWDRMGDMKFDMVVGNPPYQDKTGNENSTNSADLYVKFVERSFDLSRNYVVMVIPSAWSGARNSKLKNILFEQHQPMRFDTHGKKWFDVEMNTCWFITQKHRQGTTIITDNHNNHQEVNLCKHSVIPRDISALGIIEQMRSHAKTQNLASRWLRGKLNLNDVNSLKPGPVPFVMAVGKRNDILDIKMIPKNHEATGLNLHKLVIPNVGSSDAIGNIKYADPTMVGGHSVVFLTCKTKCQTDRLKCYLETKLIRYLVKNIKISTPNSKSLFELIPDMPYKWNSEQDLYDQFGLEQAHIDVINNTV